jgi:hypothetical protein
MSRMGSAELLPEYVARRYRRLTELAFAAALGPQLALTAANWLWPGPRPARFGMAMVALSFTAVAALLVLTARWERRVTRGIAEFGGKLCPHCAYPLPGCSGATVCPECGHACAMEQAELAWRAFQPRLRWLWKRWPGTP